MSADYKSVLIWITRLIKRQKGNTEISLTYLAGQSAYETEELAAIIGLLEKEGYVVTRQPTPKVTLIQSTISGFEKANEWDDLVLAKTPKRKFLTLGKVIGASLFTLALGSLLWWLGLSPETSGWVPLRATVPIRLYQKSIYPPNYYEPGGWYGFPNAPDDEQVISAKDYEEANKLLQKLIPGYIPVTLDGWVHITFDVENIAPSYQVNIDSVQIKITRKPESNPENLYFEPPHLGAGDWREFELTLNPASLISMEEGVEIYQAKMKSDNNEVDYIYVRPGERETFDISIKLDHPGSFELTPIINYSFHDKQSTLQSNSYTVIYPQKYRLWYWESDPQTCSGDVCTGGGGTLVSNHIILDTQSNNIEIEGQTKITGATACFSERKWIAFESSMITFGYLNRLFLIDTMGDQLRPVSVNDLHSSKRKLAWLASGQLLVDELGWDFSILDNVEYNFVVNPATLEKVEQGGEGDAEILNSNYLEKHKACFSNGLGCVENKADSDTNGYNGIDSQDLQHLFINRGDSQTRLAFVPDQEQIYPVVSPDDNWIAYIQKNEIKNKCGGISYVEGIAVVGPDDSGQRQIRDFDGWYQNLLWSPDSKYLVYSSYRPSNGVEELGQDCSTSNYHVYMLNLESGLEWELTHYDDEYSFFDISWSSDGKWLLIGGKRLTITSNDGSCSQDIFIPPLYSKWTSISNILLQP
jgi:hypothetical protein